MSTSCSSCWAHTDSTFIDAVTKQPRYTPIAPQSTRISPPHASAGSTAGCPDSSNRVDKWVSGTPANQNYYVTVNVTYDFTLYTPLMQQLVGNPIPMTVSLQMRTNS